MKRRIFSLGQFAAVIVQFGLIVLVVEYLAAGEPVAGASDVVGICRLYHSSSACRCDFGFHFSRLLSLVAVITGVGHLGPNVFTGWVTARMTDQLVSFTICFLV